MVPGVEELCVRPGVWEAPLPLSPLCSWPWEHAWGLLSGLRKHMSLMYYRNIIVFLLLITFRDNYIATRFVLYDITARSVCAFLSPEQASSPRALGMCPQQHRNRQFLAPRASPSSLGRRGWAVPGPSLCFWARLP